MPPRKKAAIELVADTTVELPPSELRLYQRNPRKGNVGAVAASLKAHGQYRPIVANIGTYTGRRLEVLKGNHTLKAFRSLAEREPGEPRWSKVLVHLVDVDEDQAKRIVLVDNKTSSKGGYDSAELASLLGDLNDSIEGFGATGFTFADLDALTPDDGPVVDVDDMVDPDDIPDNSIGRGVPVISYSIVFDTTEEKARWVEFMNWLKRTWPDQTVGERVTSYIEQQAQLRGEDEHNAE
jgi:hypothetical protein